MPGCGHSTTRLFLTQALIASLIASLLSGAARADDLNSGKSFRIERAAFAPIGKVYSLGEISINGRTVSGQQPIWGGDLLRASDDSRACVVLDSIGEVRLTRRAVVRLSTQLTTLNDNAQHPVLIATILVGDMTVSLQQGSSAYIEAGDSAFTASGAASFHLRIDHGRVMIDHVSGAVRAEPQRPGSKYIQFTTKEGGSLGPDPKQKVTRDKLEDLYTLLKRPREKPKASPPKRVLFFSSVRSISLQTTQEFLPAPAGKVVVFTLDPPTNGTFDPSASATTNSRGIAKVGFTGKVLGPAQVTATDVETGETAALAITVVKGPGIFRQRNILIAAAVGIVVCVFACGPRKGPLKQVPPPIIP